MDYRRKTLFRSGFTLLEILIVVGIIAVLVAIAVTSFKAVEGTANRNKTKMILANAQSMLTEYDAATGLREQPSYMWELDAAPPPAPPPSPAKYTAAVFDIWRDGDPSTPATFQPIKAPFGNVMELLAAEKPPQGILNAAVVLKEFQRVPGVKKSMTQLPAESTVVIRDTAMAIVGTDLVDGWGHPILYVPASGLSNVYVSGDSTATGPVPVRVVTSARIYVVGGAGAPVVGELVSGARPFFVSAGPDGLFGFIDKNANGTFDAGTDIPGGDDNLYSFEK